MMVHTNNGVEAQNRAFKHDYLQPFRTKSLSNMLTCLVDGFLVDSYTGYDAHHKLNILMKWQKIGTAYCSASHISVKVDGHLPCWQHTCSRQ